MAFRRSLECESVFFRFVAAINVVSVSLCYSCIMFEGLAQSWSYYDTNFSPYACVVVNKFLFKVLVSIYC